jgi:hypothetical protein
MVVGHELHAQPEPVVDAARETRARDGQREGVARAETRPSTSIVPSASLRWHDVRPRSCETRSWSGVASGTRFE